MGTPLKSPLYVLFNFGPCSKCGTLFECQGIVQLSECMYASGKITQHNKEIIGILPYKAYLELGNDEARKTKQTVTSLYILAFQINSRGFP